VTGGETDVGVQSGGQATQQGLPVMESEKTPESMFTPQGNAP
jgi:hypothetical protein